jgi:lipopolysaccharide transport system ATP-binding protein
MGVAVIQIEQLSKCYEIERRGKRTDTLRDALSTAIWNVGRRLRKRLGGEGRSQTNRQEFWALRDISLEVKRGEVVGIIGRNGAGKSTLLKILSRITEPTAGRIQLRGRVGSLLEVGTGFHSELTGRENVYLNGAILGMSRCDIRRKFDEIVAFAEVEEFLDVPVKRYSSGMYMRLAFAVAAHLEPEILIIDEVLAVGDIAFQRRCMGKMGDVARTGRTVLFVSHNMQAVRHLCSRVVLLQQGRLLADGPPEQVVQRYHEEVGSANFDAQTALSDEKVRRGNGAVRFHQVRVEDEAGEERFDFQMGETIRFRLGYRALRPAPVLYTCVALRSGLTGEVVTSDRHPITLKALPAGSTGTVTVEWPAVSLRPGEYGLYFWLGDAATKAYDVVDGLIGPLRISVEGSIEELGFDPGTPCGYFNVASRMVNASPEVVLSSAEGSAE